MKILVAFEQGEAAERIAQVIGGLATGAIAEVHFLTVLQPGHMRGTEAGDNAEHALTPAATSSGQLLHAEEPQHRRAESRSQAVERAITNVSESHKALASRFFPGADIQSHVATDDNIASAILRTTVSLAVDLVAMGTHGRTGLSHLVLGSVAETIMRNATVPVLVVGPKAGSGLA